MSESEEFSRAYGLLATENRDLRIERDALQKLFDAEAVDANRYRWLRNYSGVELFDRLSRIVILDNFDMAVDSAMAADAKQQAGES